jgi:hypothetical protein
MPWLPARRWVWVPLVLIVAPFLLIALGELRKFIDRRMARIVRFQTLDSATEERMMLGAAIPDSFSSKFDMLLAVEMLGAPGYGSMGNVLVQADGSVIWFHSIEIPGRHKDRGLVYREVAGSFVKLDDFVYDTHDHLISDVRADGEQLSYVDLKARIVRVKRIGSKAAQETRSDSHYPTKP